MATNHFALYCAVSNDKTHYKIGLTQQTKRAREQRNFVIVGYADFYNHGWDRKLLFFMEKLLRGSMSNYYDRDWSTNDYYFVETYNIEEFFKNFVASINGIVTYLKQRGYAPHISYHLEDYRREVASRLEDNNYTGGLSWTEYIQAL